MDLVKMHLQRLSELKSERLEHEQEWKECYEMTAPERLPSFGGVKEDRKKARAKLFDTTGANATQILISAIISGTTPANAVWFKAVPDGVDDQGEMTDGERWLDAACRTMWRNIHGSNFDSENPDTVSDSVIAGWGVLYIAEDDEDGIVFENWGIDSTYIASTKRSGTIDTVYKVCSMTASAMINEYGEDNVHYEVVKCAKDNSTKRFEVLHAICPRKDGQVKGIAKNKPFASIHIDISNKKLLRESGYDEFPCAVPRMYKKVNSFYATGQVSKALPDIKQLNALARMNTESAEMSIFGMWALVDDGIMNPSSVVIGPKKVAIVRDPNSITRIEGGSNYQITEYEGDRLARNIQSILMADQLRGFNDKTMTATEVTERVNLIRQQLGPMFGRWQTELLSAILERCFAIEMRRGTFGEMPEELYTQTMQFKFVNPLARSQQLEEVANTELFLSSLAGVSQLDPSMLDNVNFDKAINVISSGRGVPDSIIRTPEEVAKLRQARQEAQQQQEQQQQMQQMQQGALETAQKQVESGGI